MTLQLNSNVNPYHDDFDPDDNYYRVMYKPGFPIQARELTTMQSMLQEQIELLASRIMANGDQVVPGNYGFENNLSYVRVSSITQGATAKEYEGFILTGSVSGVKAKVLNSTEENDEDDTTFYVQYEDSGIGSETRTFTEGETLECDNPDRYTATVGITAVSKPLNFTDFGGNTVEASPPMGKASIFNIEPGSFYVDGFIVKNEGETILVSKYGTKPNCEIGFLVSEEFVTAGEDPSLLDNAQGHSNFAAPGADRLKITLTLQAKLIEENLPNFITLVRVVQGNLQGKPDQTVKWDWLWEILARRTYDESGDYICDDFAIKRLEYANTEIRDGLYEADEDGLYPPPPGSPEDTPRLTYEEADSKYVIEVSKGKAYVQGYEVGLDESIYVFGDKPRTPQFNYNSFTQLSRGSFLALTNTFNSPDLSNYTGQGRAEAFDPIILYRNFLDGFVGNATTPSTVEDGDGNVTSIRLPLNRGFEPLSTLHIICEDEISANDNTANVPIYGDYFIMLEGKSAVLAVNTTTEGLKRGDTLGSSTIAVVNRIDAQPAGFIRPRSYIPRQIIGGKGGFESFTSTYNLGILTANNFTEIAVVTSDEDTNTDQDWQVGALIRGEISGALAEVEKGSSKNILIVSPITGELLNSEPIEQEATGKTASIIRPGEVIGFDFPFSSSAYTTNNYDELTCTSLGAEITLKEVDGDYTKNADGIFLTQQGRDKLITFPYALDNTSDDFSKVNITVTTATDEVGYAVFSPAKITHTINKTKSVYGELNHLIGFSGDISTETQDAETFTIAEGALFSGKIDDPTGKLPPNCLVSDNYSGDPSEQLVNGDLIAFSDDTGAIVERIVKFVTAPAGSGSFREKSRIYLTTALPGDVNGKIIQRIRNRTVGDPEQAVVFRLPEQVVKSLETNPEDTGINYSVTKLLYQEVQGGADSVTLVSSNENENFLVDGKTSVCVAKNLVQAGDSGGYEGRSISIVQMEIKDSGRKLVIYFDKPLKSGLLLKIVTSVRVIDGKAKRKILRDNIKVTIPYPQSTNRILSLGKADVIRLRSVKLINEEDEDKTLDITNNYYLDTGTRKNFYDISTLVLKDNYPTVTNKNNFSGEVEVLFDYLEHDNQGDFFSVDSYTHDDGLPYNQIPFYQEETQGASDPDGKLVATRLADCIDFRPIVNTSATDPSVLSINDENKSIIDSLNFKDSIFNGDGFAPRMPVVDSQFQSDIEYFVGKFDSLFLTKQGGLHVISGEQSRDPIRPGDISSGIRLYDLRIQPFCVSAKNNIKVKKFNYRRYRMKDIYHLDKRIERLEEIISLTLLEQAAVKMNVKDAVTGLDRFKNGIIVDNFTDHSRGDVQSVYYRCSVDRQRSLLRPPFFSYQVDLREKNSTEDSRLLYGNYKNNSGLCTLPYTEVDFAGNPFASRYVNLQVYNLFTFEGVLTIDPEVDTFKNERRLDDIVIEDNAVWNSMNAMIDGLYDVGVLGTVWGAEERTPLIEASGLDWNSREFDDVMDQIDALSTDNVFTNTVSETRVRTNRGVVIQDQNSMNMGMMANALQRLGGRNMGFFNTNMVMNPGRTEMSQQEFFANRGAGAWRRTGQRATRDVQAFGQRSEILNMSIEGGSVQETSYGDRVVNVNLAETMRTVAIRFTMSKCKPNTRVYAFFDGVDVSRWVSPDFPRTDYDDEITRAVLMPGTNQKGFGQPIITDGVGNATGVFIIPNGRPPRMYVEAFDEEGNDYQFEQIFNGNLEEIEYELNGTTRSFPTGQRKLRFTSNKDNKESHLKQSELVDTYAEKMFTSSGVFLDKQETIIHTRVVDNIETTREAGETRITEVQIQDSVVESWALDPVGQTFEVDKNYKEGVFVTELEVFFRTKDKTQGVEAYLVPTSGDVPDKTIIPLSRVTKDSDTLLRVTAQLDNLGSQTIREGTILTGLTSGATGIVKTDTIFQNVEDNPEKNETNYVYNIIMNNYVGEFFEGEEIADLTPPPAGVDVVERKSVFTICANEIDVLDVEVQKLGSGYLTAENTTVQFSQPELPGGVSAIAVPLIKDGKVYHIRLIDPGSGYTKQPSVEIISNEAGAGAEAVVRVSDGRKSVKMGVATSEDASAGTKFKFHAPIFLQGQTSYGIILKAPTSLEYTAWISQLGEDTLDGGRVTVQPLLGSLFRSQNGGLWTENQYQDLKFNLKRASFIANVDSKVVMENVSLYPHIIGKNPIETNADGTDTTSVYFGVNPRIVRISHDWHGLAPGDLVSITGVLGNPGGIPDSNFNTMHTVIAADLQTFTIDVGVPAENSERSGGITVRCSYNRPFECLTVTAGVVQPPGTNLLTTARVANHAGVTLYNESEAYTIDSPRIINLEKKFYFENAKQIASQLTEAQYNDTFHLKGNRSINIDVTMRTSDEAISPILDVTRTNAITTRNLVDSPDYSNPIYGPRTATITTENAMATDLLAVGDSVTYADSENNTRSLNVQRFNPITKKITFKGEKVDDLVRGVTFDNADLAGVNIIRTTLSDPDSFRPETQNNGSVFAKWISRVFTLENECDGIELRMSTVFYDPADIRVYYKTKSSGTVDNESSDFNWIPFNPNQSKPGEVRKIKDGVVITPGDSDYDTPGWDYLPTPGLCDDVAAVNARSTLSADPDILGAVDFQQLNWNIQDLAMFDGIQIKIVMTATNPARCPLIDDIQLIASE